jgi:transcriptional regulator
MAIDTGFICPYNATIPFDWPHRGARMYIPKSFSETDITVLYQFIRDNNFAPLITHKDGELLASHIPWILDTERGVLTAHLARANPQWKAFDGSEALVTFTGPHAYISPTWYQTHPSVPTWNYTAVHVYGMPQLIDDEARSRPILQALVENHEHGRRPEWEMGGMPEDYFQTMLKAIVVFELPVSRIEGKYKLSQNRSEVDQQSVIAHLADSPYPVEVETGKLMAERRG